MSILNIIETFSDEASCANKLRQIREKQGIICPKCSCDKHYWKHDKQCWECKSCHFRTSLTSGTIMHKTKLPLRYWFIAMGFVSSLKKGISAKELQRQLGHNRYEPIWAMLHKIRIALGKRDAQYQLNHFIELDHGFFNTATTNRKERKQLTNAKSAVIVMTQVQQITEQQLTKNRPNRKVSYLKMIQVSDMKRLTVNHQVKQHVSNNTAVITDNYRSYYKLADVIKKHVAVQCFDRATSTDILPWVHIAISNAKRWLLGMHNHVKGSYLQNYLNEFCYKFNRRYFGHKLMDRVLIAAISCRWNL